MNFVVRTLSVVMLATVTASSAAAQVAVLSSTVEERTVMPGERYRGTIVIGNAAAEPQTARLYQTDYRFSADGTSGFDQPGTMRRSNAAWIEPQVTRVVIPAGGQVTVSYDVAVPPQDVVGSYWSVIMVEGAPDARNQNAGDKAVTLGSTIRYAVQVATHIQGTGNRALRFAAPQATVTNEGEARLDIDVRNDGERAVRPAMWVELYDTEGTLRAKLQQARGLLYPETSLHQQFVLGRLPKGKYKAVVFADTGDDAVFAKQLTIEY